MGESRSLAVDGLRRAAVGTWCFQVGQSSGISSINMVDSQGCRDEDNPTGKMDHVPRVNATASVMSSAVDPSHGSSLSHGVSCCVVWQYPHGGFGCATARGRRGEQRRGRTLPFSPMSIWPLFRRVGTNRPSFGTCLTVIFSLLMVCWVHLQQPPLLGWISESSKDLRMS